MANPRILYTFHRLRARAVTMPSDTSIVAPAVTANGLNPTMSAQLGMAVTLVNTTTNGPKVGLGSATNALFGKVTQVSPNGVVTVQDDGYAYFDYVTGGSIPLPGIGVAVDGAGKVQKNTGEFRSICVGFGTNPEPLTAAGDGVLQCIVKIN